MSISHQLRDEFGGSDAVTFAWIAVLVAAVADLASTGFGLHAGHAEGNPIVAWILATTGFGGFVAFKVLVIVAVALVASRILPLRTVAPLVLTVTWGLVAAINVVVIFVV